MYSIIYQHDQTGLRGKAIKHLATPAGEQVTVETALNFKYTALKEEFSIIVEVEINGATYVKTIKEAKNVKRKFFSRLRIWALSLCKQTEIKPDYPVSLGLAYIINEYIKIVYKTSELNRKQRDNVTLAFRRNFEFRRLKI